MVICLAWTFGINIARMEEFDLECDQDWVNHSQGKPLPKDYYHCPATNEVYQCKSKEYRVCYLAQAEPPTRLENEVDVCYYTGMSLNNGRGIFEISYMPIDMINNYDYIKIYVLDQDKAKQGMFWIDSLEYSVSDNGIMDLMEKVEFEV